MTEYRMKQNSIYKYIYSIKYVQMISFFSPYLHGIFLSHYVPCLLTNDEITTCSFAACSDFSIQEI